MTLAALIVLGIVALASVAALVYLQRDNRLERAALIDRIQAPEAVHLAAVERAIGQREVIDLPDPYDEAVPVSDDVALERLIS